MGSRGILNHLHFLDYFSTLSLLGKGWKCNAHGEGPTFETLLPGHTLLLSNSSSTMYNIIACSFNINILAATSGLSWADCPSNRALQNSGQFGLQVLVTKKSRCPISLHIASISRILLNHILISTNIASMNGLRAFRSPYACPVFHSTGIYRQLSQSIVVRRSKLPFMLSEAGQLFCHCLTNLIYHVLLHESIWSQSTTKWFSWWNGPWIQYAKSNFVPSPCCLFMNS